MQPNLVAIDLAKRCFQVCLFDRGHRPYSNRKLSRAKFVEFLAQLAPTTVAMEACAASHYWGRKLGAGGQTVQMIPPQHVKAFRRVHKSDGHDAIAIGEAALRPNMHFVPVKSVEQQDLQLLGRVRERQIAQRTAIINQVRGLAREYGVEFDLKRRTLMGELPTALEDAENDLSPVARKALGALYDELRDLDERIEENELQIDALAQQHPAYERLRSIPGLGRINTPTLLASLGNGHQFRSGRHCAAWLGLVPRQDSTGGRQKLGGITKNGDRSLRVQLIHGARAVIRWAERHDHAQSRWIRALVARRGTNKAVVALANKLARIAWAVLTSEKAFDMRLAFRPQPAR